MRHFTLVELMIVVAIIAVLAAIAIPFLADYQRRSKQAEMPTNVNGLLTSYTAWRLDSGLDHPATGSYQYVPTSTPGKTPVSWGSPVAFNAIGWSPDGNVRGTYSFGVAGDELATSGCSGTNTAKFCVVPNSNFVCAGATMDVDGDGKFSAYIRDNNTGVYLAPTMGCY